MSDARAPSAGRRIAAVAALLTLVAALVLVGLSVVQNPGRVILGLVLLGLAVAAAWGALIHRGIQRIVAPVIALAAVVAVILLLDLTSVVRIVVLAVLVAASTAAAAVAFGNDPVRPAGTSPVPAARHGVLIMNPRSGGGKVGKFGLVERARELGIEPVLLEPGDDLRALAEKAIAEGADVLGMAGGDGSQALVADVARQHDVALVCIPAGTRNHFALDLGLDRVDVPAALAAFGEAVERRIDLALIGDRVFVNNASLGVYAAVVQSDEYRDAKLATTARMLPDLVGPQGERLDLRYTGPDGSPRPPADVVLVSNNVYLLDSMRGFGTRERIDGGTLGVVTVSVDRASDLPALMAAEAAGQLRRYKGYAAWDTPEFEVDSSDPLIDVGVDGEALRLAPPLRFRSLPGALRVRIPVSAPGNRAARGPHGLAEAIPALFRVARGRPV